MITDSNVNGHSLPILEPSKYFYDIRLLMVLNNQTRIYIENQPNLIPSYITSKFYFKVDLCFLFKNKLTDGIAY